MNNRAATDRNWSRTINAADGHSIFRLTTHLHKLHTHRRPQLKLRARGRQLAALLIDLEFDQRIRILIAGDQPLACRIDSKSTRRLALGWRMADERQLTRRLIDGVSHDAVMPAV